MRAWITACFLLVAAPAAAQLQDISRPGTVAHGAARAGFPEEVGAFRRRHVIRYAEHNLSANYDLRRDDHFLRLSVYIYPAQRVPEGDRAAACREELARIDSEIVQYRPNAERVELGEATALPDVGPGLHLRMIHRVTMALRSREPEAVRRETRLYCFVGGDWNVKFYASSNAAFEVDDAIESFIRTGPWPGRGPGSIALLQGAFPELRSLR